MRIPITMSHGTNHWRSSYMARDDGGPPHSVRYITKDTDTHRLPSMEYDAFRSYLEGALLDALVEAT